MQHHPRTWRSSRKPKLPPSGPQAPRRTEIDVPMVRRQVPADETLAEMIALMPEWLQAQARAEIPREIYAEAGGQLQLLPRTHKPRTQTTFLAKTQQDNDDETE